MEYITRNLPTALLVCEAKEHGRILFVNKAMLDLFECTNTGDFMACTQEKAENIIWECERERMSRLIWQQADNPNYGKVFYASIAEYGLICGHLTNDDKTTC